MKHSRFAPGRIDYDGPMARNYDAGRGLSREAAIAWRAALEPHLGRFATILDVGSGTGRFAMRLAEWFGAHVVGIEPAQGMRRAARATASHPGVAYVGGRAEHLPLCKARFDAALVSNVLHHIPDRAACARELGRVLRPGGRVVIRGAFGDRLDGITLFDYFPEARRVAEAFPALEPTIAIFRAAGFEYETLQPVVQQTCERLKAMAERTRSRADTTLELLTDDEFARGQTALERAAAAEFVPAPILDTIDLLVLRSAERR